MKILAQLILLLMLTVLPSWTAHAQEWITPPEPVIIGEAYTPPAGFDTVEGPYVRLHGHPGDDALLLRLSRHAAQAASSLSDELNVPIGGPIDVIVAGSEAEFRELQPTQTPSWADAVAYPSRGVIFLRAPRARIATDEPIEQVLDHELVHIILGRAFAPEVPPAWLQEGVAQVLAHQLGPQTIRTLHHGVALNGSLMSLESLGRGFPADANRARFAYAQSADFIGWLRNKYGEDVIAKLIEETRKGTNIHGAVRIATGSFLDDIESDWGHRFGPSWNFSVTSLFSVDALWGMCGVLLIIGGVQRRREFHANVKRMEEEEALVDELLMGMHRRRMGLDDWRA